MASAVPDAATIVQLGDPRLRQLATPVRDFGMPSLLDACASLHATLAAFRARHGFGRAIAAPQIGLPIRLVAVHLDGRSFVMANPEITWASPATVTLWDDCLSFPSLLVRVRRARSISIRCRDEQGEERTFDRLEPTMSELIQHELDHLDGVLAPDRALDRQSLVLRSVYDLDPAWFQAQVDHTPAR